MADKKPTRRHSPNTMRSGVQIRTGGRYKFRIRSKKLTLQEVGAILCELETQEGLVEARRFAATLDYARLVELCKKWQADPAGEAKNDPNTHVHPRFMLLPFMDDAKVPEDAREGLFPGDGAGPILEMTRALRDLGVDCKESAVFDDEVLAQYLAWNAQQKPAAAS